MSRRSLVLWIAPILSLAACGGAPPAAPSSGQGALTAPPAASVAAAASVSQDPGSVQVSTNVDIGGRTLHLFCVGAARPGVPTVLAESGLGGDSRTWNDIFYGVADRTRVCAYDRAGLYLSQPAPQVKRTLTDEVADLRALVKAAKLDGPLVLVGHSVAVWHIALYTSQFPDDVAAVVLADPRGPGVSADWLSALPRARAGEPPSIAANRDELTTFENDPSMNDEHLDLVASGRQAEALLKPASRLFGKRPLVVLSGGMTTQSWSDLPEPVRTTFDRIWHDAQAAIVAESDHGSMTVVKDSDHDIPGMRPDAIVDAVLAVLDQVAP
jgi:pimeloyl-ACP methyl ester carboxylesterase